MNLIQKLKNRFGFGYDAVESNKRRRQVTNSVWSEDRELRDFKRRSLAANARDLRRNFTIPAWAIRKHLDYVSTFSFQCRTGDSGLDNEIENLIAWYSRPQNCDAAGRHSLQEFTRLCEECAVVDGDVLVNMLATGKLQAVEGDRVTADFGAKLEDYGIDASKVVNGVIVDDFGAARGYVVTKRSLSGLEFDRVLSAQFAHLHGYFQRFDQVRGVSPLAPAINSYRDVYEACDYALAKAKVSQLFALAFYRENSEQLGTLDETTGDEESTGYSVDFGKGPVQLDLDPGDRAEFLESKNPSSEFQAFTQTMIGMALKSLDIPYSFYAENFTNYSGARQALLQYEQSAKVKKDRLRRMLDRITQFRIGMFIADGDLVLPNGFAARDLNWEWVSAGIPWIDPLKEINADVASLGACLTSPQRTCREHGDDFFEIVDEMAAAKEYAESKGVTLSFTPVPVQVIQNDQQQTN